MKNIILECISVFLSFFVALSLQAETLTQYVNSCKSELEFTSIPNNLNCYDGILFDRGSGKDPIRDYVGYAKITNDVDLAFACRWLLGTIDNPRKAISLELTVHNRKNGKTCFFAAKDGGDNLIVSPAIVSPTSNQAGSYWKTPTEVNNGDKCVNCHVKSVYVVSPKVAPALATFGLLNNGHDTFVDRNNPAHYKVVGAGNNNSAFNEWHTLIDTFIARPSPSTYLCSESCHSIAYYSTAPTITRKGGTENFTLLTSISQVIANIGNNMPPSQEDSPYRWINRNINTSTGSAEYFAEAKNDYPGLLSSCGVPTKLEAHAVGNPYSFSSSDFLPDTLDYFNLREGLKCVNSAQTDGSCNNYETRYLCYTDVFGGEEWTDWASTDTPSGTSDVESRSRYPYMCANPMSIQARTKVNGVTFSAYGPNDRIATLTPTSVVCNDADQVNGAKCSNYVARYSNCITAPADYAATIKSAWSGKMLTASGGQNDAETKGQPLNTSWNTQKWIFKTIEGTTQFVRLRNVGINNFLNAQSQAENAKSVTYELHADWKSEQWLIEPISGSNEVRFKNVWSGKYLTLADNSNYSAVLLQTLNTSWASQRWVLQKQ